MGLNNIYPIPRGQQMKIQYSITGQIAWHNVFVVGDKYMRVSVDNGNSWSAGMKFIGDAGDPGAAGVSSGMLFVTSEEYYNTENHGSDAVFQNSNTDDLEYTLVKDTLTAKGDKIEIESLLIIAKSDYSTQLKVFVFETTQLDLIDLTIDFNTFQNIALFIKASLTLIDVTSNNFLVEYEVRGTNCQLAAYNENLENFNIVKGVSTINASTLDFGEDSLISASFNYSGSSNMTSGDIIIGKFDIKLVKAL